MISLSEPGGRGRAGGAGITQKHVSREAPSDPAGLVGPSDAKERVHCLLTTMIDFAVKEAFLSHRESV